MIWFDLDNSPHVPLFRPILKELEKRNVEFIVTTRDYAQTAELLSFWGIEHTVIGAHAGRNKVKKVLNLLNRSHQLKNFIADKNITLAVSHGSRSQLVAAKMLGIRSILMLDYEYTEARIFNKLSTKLLMPVYIPDERLRSAGFNLSKVIRYNGFKEEIYLSDFIPDKSFRSLIDVKESDILVVIRPPGMSGNYHDPRSEKLLTESINYFSSFQNTVCLIVNRTQKEKDYMSSKLKLKNNTRFLEKAVDGLQLLFAADIAVSGGGTMNREAALLGTRTYSIFTGRYPYLDELLQKQGKLYFVKSACDIKNISVEKHSHKDLPSFNNNLATDITNKLIEAISKSES